MSENDDFSARAVFGAKLRALSLSNSDLSIEAEEYEQGLTLTETRDRDPRSENSVPVTLIARTKSYALGNNVADILIIAALDEEISGIKKTLLKNTDIEEREVDGFYINFAQLNYEGFRLSIAVYALAEMGMVPAAAITTQLAILLQPKIVILTGICAGREDKTKIGDIVVASDVFNYNSVKKMPDGTLADYPHVPLNTTISNILTSLVDKEEVAHLVESEWSSQTGRPDTRLKIKMGPFATGSAVVADRAIFTEIREHQRRTLGLDMEAFGVARAVHYLDGIRWIVVKSVSDYADENKAKDSGEVVRNFDIYREYCCTMSGAFVREVIYKIVKSDRLKISKKSD